MPVLTFKGKTAVENYHYTIPHHTLEFDEKLSVLEKGQKPGLDGNLIVEGDNLIALKALLPTHAGRIKCIYIDPPYNTGNEGWVYNDNLTQPQFKEWIGQTVGKEGEDASRHDKWCCMMYPRLQLLKELLSDDGFIFISIDDIEVNNLRTICDEIFGVDRFLACLVWKARQYTDARSTTGVSTDHEYVLVYSKTPNARIRGGERDESKYSNPDNDPRGPWMSRSILGLAPVTKRPNLHYDLVDPKTGWKFPPEEANGWRYDKKTMSKKISEGRILFPKKKDGRPREKVFLQELKTKNPGLSSVIDDVFTADGTAEVREIFGDDAFSFPKPTELIRRLVAQVTEEDDFVLDSFAGSGTTGHAVLKQNELDGGNRKFILVQIPDEVIDGKKSKNLTRDLTVERVSRVIRGYKTSKRKTEAAIYEEKIGMTLIKRGAELLEHLEILRKGNEKNFDEIKTEVKDGVLMLKGIRFESASVEGLGGNVSYATIGKPILTEARSFGRQLPTFEALGKYVFYTETGRTLDERLVDQKSFKLGEMGDTSYFLLYAPGKLEGQALSKDWLDEVARMDQSKNWVIYCEKIWVHRDDREAFEKRTGKSLRVMQLPFHLK